MSTYNETYKKCKMRIKLWEHEFKKQENRAPSKNDIKAAPDSVREAYKRYWLAKTSLLEEVILCDDNQGQTADLDKQPDEEDTVGIIHVQPPLKSTAELPIKETVWGEHLMKTVEKSRASKFQKSSSFEFTQKLFKGVKLKKKNTKKSNSVVEKSTLQRTKSFPIEACSQIGNVEDLVAKTKDGTEKGTNDSDSNIRDESLAYNKDIQFNFGPVKIISGKPVISIQSVGVLHVTDNPTDTRSSFKNKLNEGWLERCHQKCTVDDSEIVTENKVLSEDKTEISKKNCDVKIKDVVLQTIDCLKFDASSDDDYIFSSDDEGNKSTKKNSDRLSNIPPSCNVRNSEKIGISIESTCDSLPVNELEVPKKISVSQTPFDLSEKSDIKSKILERSEFPKRPGDELSSEAKKPKLQNTISDIDDKKTNRLFKKFKDGTVNDNYVKIDITKKRYSRGKKFKSSASYKVQQWKNKKKLMNQRSSNFSNGEMMKCFKCGDIGHLMRHCKKQNTLLPLIDNDDEEIDSPFPTLDEAAKMVEAGNNIGIIATKAIQTIDEIVEPELEDLSQLKTVSPLYDCRDDGSLPGTPHEVYEALYELGYDNFRPGQEAVIMRILCGKSTLMVSGTGSGKSLCYQLPALLFSKKHRCLSLVISPLVALMEDQVVNFPSALKAACLHTNQTPQVREKLIKEIEDGKISVLLISPETMISGEKGILGRDLVRNFPPVAFVCIDEAHCVSQWSHNFRTSYLLICKVLRERYNIKTFLGLTATASKSTLSSVTNHLGIEDSTVGVVYQNLLPDNLLLSVSKDEDKDRTLLKILSSSPFCEFDSIIIYCLRRNECERLASLLRTTLQHLRPRTYENARSNISVDVEVYHAGLTAARRKRVQSNFMKGKLRIVIATVAFGMGINKADIRGIIHYNMPRTFEHYVQEIGRAGRNGLPARCHLLCSAEGEDLNELKRSIFRDSIDRTTLRNLLSRLFLKCSCEGLCRKHEISFPVEQIVTELDIPQENISTLLCYIELLPEKFIEVLPLTYTKCTVISYNGVLALQRAARKCAPLAFAIAEYLKNESSSNITARFQFSVIELADKIGWKSGVVKQELKRCEWTFVNEKWKKTGISVTFEDLGFHVRSVGNIAEQQLDTTLENLEKRVSLQESTALHQLEMCYIAFNSVALRNIDDFYDDECIKEQNQKLKECIVEYFQKEQDFPIRKQVDTKIRDEMQVISNIRNLVSGYPDCTFSGRSIARIFHGIESPNFPAISWGRSPYWRCGLKEDFNALRCLARQELLKFA